MSSLLWSLETQPAVANLAMADVCVLGSDSKKDASLFVGSNGQITITPEYPTSKRHANPEVGE